MAAGWASLFPGVGDTLLSARWGPGADQSSARRAEGLQAVSPPGWGRHCAPHSAARVLILYMNG